MTDEVQAAQQPLKNQILLRRPPHPSKIKDFCHLIAMVRLPPAIVYFDSLRYPRGEGFAATPLSSIATPQQTEVQTFNPGNEPGEVRCVTNITRQPVPRLSAGTARQSRDRQRLPAAPTNGNWQKHIKRNRRLAQPTGGFLCKKQRQEASKQSKYIKMNDKKRGNKNDTASIGNS